MLNRMFVFWVAVVVALFTAPASGAIMYVTDGDNELAWIVDTATGSLVDTFPTYPLAYPLAVTDTVRIAHRDNEAAAEYGLDGVPTGVTYPGGPSLTQMLDGSTDGVAYNYAVLCCGAAAVYRADLQWQEMSFLFALPEGGQGIAYDPVTTTLWVSAFDDTVTQYSLFGVDLFSFSASLAGLAYDPSTDSFWGYAGAEFTNFNRSGATLRSFTLDSMPSSNPYGGEIAMAAPAPIPEPGTTVLLVAGLAALALRRKLLRAP